jgi:hypothetical protein
MSLVSDGQGMKFSESKVAFANETEVELEQSAQGIELSYSAAVEKMRACNLKIIEIAHANTEAVFEFVRQLAMAKGPSDHAELLTTHAKQSLAELWRSHAKKQFDMISEQIKELRTLGHNFDDEGVELIARSINQAFDKGSERTT